jgi:hypothetical protein
VPLDLTPLANVGAVGVVLAWFMLVTIPRLERIERAVDILSKAILLDQVSRPGVSPVVKAQAQGMINTIDDKYKASSKQAPP